MPKYLKTDFLKDIENDIAVEDDFYGSDNSGEAEHNPFIEEVDQSSLNSLIEKTFSKNKFILNLTKIPLKLKPIEKSITDFFQDKHWHIGGTIPSELLYTKNNFYLINNISLINAIDLGYCSIAFDEAKFHINNNDAKKAASKLQEVYEKNKSSQVKNLISMLDFCKEDKIKQINYQDSEHYDIKLCMKTINSCKKLKIPVSHQGGLFLIFLNICKGITLLN
jgi:hypothetical protein